MQLYQGALFYLSSALESRPAAFRGWLLQSFRPLRQLSSCGRTSHRGPTAAATPPPPLIINASQGDFMNIPVEKDTFDHAYQLEATCHAPDLRGCYACAPLQKVAPPLRYLDALVARALV